MMGNHCWGHYFVLSSLWALGMGKLSVRPMLALLHGSQDFTQNS